MMANEMKKISIGSFERIAKENSKSDFFALDWHGEQIIVKHKLGLNDMIIFVNGVVDNCFTEDGSYIPEVKSFSIRSGVMEMYGNFRLPNKLAARYDLLFSDAGLEAYDLILKNIDHIQFGELLDAIDDKIDYRANTDISSANRQINELVRGLTEMEKQLADTFSGLSKEDLNGLISSLSKGIDEEKLMKAYLSRGEAESGDVTDGKEMSVD